MPPPAASDPRLARLQELSLQALAHLQRGNAGQAAPLVEQMAPLLADRPQLARQMRQAVAVVGFDWPADRSPVTLAAAPPPEPANVELVSFHVDLPEAPSGLHGGVDYGAVLAQSFESARLRAPAARRVLLTDEATAVPDLGPGVEVLRYRLDRSRLMFERMRIQAEYLRDRPAIRATVLMDSDVVVNAEPSPIFSEDFDVGLTHRSGLPEAPLNGGMIFVAPGQAGARFLAKALDCYESLASRPSIASLYPADLRAWWGDQFALAALVGWRALGQRTGEAVGVDGIRVRIFPCDTHNYTLEQRAYRAEDLRHRYFVHFKGKSKAMLPMYLEALRQGHF
jgi:hypothetical protein